MSQKPQSRAWRWVRLGDLLLPQETRNPQEYPRESFFYVDISSTDSSPYRSVITPRLILGQDAPSRARKVIRTGDVIYATTRPYLRNIALIDNKLDGQICSTGFCVLRAGTRILSEYVYYFVRSNLFLDQVLSRMRGSNYPAVSDKDVFVTQIPLPPLPVQHAIVTILDKASIIRGKQDNVSSLAEQVLLALFLEVFSDPTTDLKVWKTFPLGSLGEIVSGVTKGQRLRNRDTVEVPYLRVANVQDGYLDLSEVKTIKVPSSDIEKYQLQAGDLLLTEGGDPDKLGRGYIWNNEIEKCIHQNHIFRVRSDQEKVLPIYLAALMRTSYAKDYFLRAAKRSSNLASINMSQLRAFPVPLPPLDLQRSYIESVETLSSARFSLRSSTDQIHSLFSSLLTRAFTGELIAEWEAANAERIATEVARLAQRPRLALLTLIVGSQQYHSEPIGITSLMKYAFLAQMQGTTLSQPTSRLYNFVPYHFGPFTQDLYADLKVLEAKGWITVERTTNGFFDISERVDISLNTERKNEVESALAQLSDAERADLDAIIEKYGSLSHNELLDIVYSQYPAYASKSRLRKNHS